MRKRRNIDRFVIGAFVSALVASFLPIWKTWFVSSWEEVANKGTLYEAVSFFSRQNQEFGLLGAIIRYHVGNSILLAVILVVGGVTSLFLGRTDSKHKPCDY